VYEVVVSGTINEELHYLKKSVFCSEDGSGRLLGNVIIYQTGPYFRCCLEEKEQTENFN
jgi:hypothetical protein